MKKNRDPKNPGDATKPRRIVQVPGFASNWLVRKLSRSKRLTRIFLLDQSILQLAPIRSLHDAKTLTLRSAEPLHPVKPCIIEDKGYSLNTPTEIGFFPPLAISEINSAKIHGRSNLIIKGRSLIHHDLINLPDDLLPEELCGKITVDTGTWQALRRGRKQRSYYIDTAAVFTDAVSPNYAHWLTEVLPRIFFFLNERNGGSTPIVIDAGLHANILRSLDIILDTSRASVYMVPDGREILLGLAHIVHPTGYIPFEPRGVKLPGQSHGTFSPFAISGMVEKIKEKLNPSGTGRKIYVKRNSRIRHLLNAKEIEDMMVSDGYEVIEPEKMTFDEQVHAFHSADHIVGATGAAFANLIFCQPHCKVTIFISSHPETPYYYWQNIARCIGVQINYIICPVSDEAPVNVHSNFWVPSEAVKKLVNAFPDQVFGKRADAR